MEPIPRLDIEVAGAGCSHTFLLMYSTTIDGDMRRTLIANFMVTPYFGLAKGLLQTVQRSEYWVVELALLAFSGIHIGIENLKLLRAGRKVN